MVAAAVVLALPAATRADVTGVGVAVDSTAAGDVSATWAFTFTTGAGGALDHTTGVQITFPAGIDPSGASGAILGSGFVGSCMFPPSPVAGQTVTVVLPVGCELPHSSEGTISMQGIDPSAGTYPAAGFTVATDVEPDPVAATGSDIVIGSDGGGGGGGGGTSVSAVSFSGSSTAAGATANWTVGFTSSSSGAFAGGAAFGYVGVTFPAGFTIPTPTVSAALLTGFAGTCSGALGVNVGGQRVEVDLPTGCSVGNSTAATLRLDGITNPTAGSHSGASVDTRADTTPTAAGAISIAAETFRVAFDPNGGTGSTSDQTFTAGVAQALTANAFTFTGRTFTGWNTAADGTGTSYSDGQSVTISADTTLFAQWAGPPARLVVTQQPAGATARSAFATQPVVRVEDAQGRLMSSAAATVVVTGTACGGAVGGTTSVAAANGVATFTDLSVDSGGSCTLRFRDTTNGLTVDSSSFTVAKIATSISLSVSPDKPSYPFGETVTITATVTGVPDGSEIDFRGTTATVRGGSAAFTSPVIAFGQLPTDIEIRASYAGDAAHAAAETATVRTVKKAPSTTTVAWDAATGTLTAVVGMRDPLSYGGQTLELKAQNGTVEFFDGTTGTSLGAAAVESGVATLKPSTAALPAGTHTIRAVYNGADVYLAASTGELSGVVVPRRKTDLKLTVSATKLEWGRPLTFTATVPAEATGHVDVYYRMRAVAGKTVTPAATPKPFRRAAIVHGVATFEAPASASHGLVEYYARYAGDQTYTRAQTGPVEVTTTKRPLTLRLRISSNTPAFGTTLTATATVKPAATRATVTFFSFDGDHGRRVGSAPLDGGTATIDFEVPDTPGARRKLVAFVSDPRYDVDYTAATRSFAVVKRMTRLFAMECDGSGSIFNCPLRRNERVDPAVAHGRYWYVVPHWGDSRGSEGTQNAYGRTVTELSLPANRIPRGTITVEAGGVTIAAVTGRTFVKKLCTRPKHGSVEHAQLTGCGDDPLARDHTLKHICVTISSPRSLRECDGFDPMRWYFEHQDDTGPLAHPLAAFDFGPMRAHLPAGTKTVKFKFTPDDSRYSTAEREVAVPIPGRLLAQSTVSSQGGSSSGAGITVEHKPGTFKDGSTLTLTEPAVKSSRTFTSGGKVFDVTVRRPEGTEDHGPFDPPLVIRVPVGPAGWGDTCTPPAPSVYDASGRARALVQITSVDRLGGRSDGYVDDTKCYAFSGGAWATGDIKIVTKHLTTFAISPGLKATAGTRAVLRLKSRRVSLRVTPSRRARVTISLVTGSRKHAKVTRLGRRTVPSQGRIVRFRVPRDLMERPHLRVLVHVAAPDGQTLWLQRPLLRRR